MLNMFLCFIQLCLTCPLNVTLHYTTESHRVSLTVKDEVIKIGNMSIITSYSVTLYRYNVKISNDISWERAASTLTIV